MSKINYIVLLFLFWANFCFSQKKIEKEFSAEGIDALIINDDAVFKIDVQASETTVIKVSAHISGENSESVIIEEVIKENELFISTGFTPFFKKDDDKLAALKILAIEMEVTVPQNLSLKISSKIASVTATGEYKNVEGALEEGNCSLNNFMGNALLQTRQGNIKVKAQKDVSGEAISRNGKVENQLPPKARYHIVAESINGSISLLQTK